MNVIFWQAIAVVALCSVGLMLAVALRRGWPAYCASGLVLVFAAQFTASTAMFDAFREAIDEGLTAGFVWWTYGSLALLAVSLVAVVYRLSKQR